jgi:hypothetical protein
VSGIVRITITGRATDAIRALVGVRTEANRTDKDLKKLNGSTGSLTSATSVFGTVAKIAASRTALYGGAVLSLLPAAIQVAAALSPLLGLMVSLPGITLAGVGALAALKIATIGVSDAITAGMTGDTVAMAKAMDAIPPAAQRFVTAVTAQRQAIRDLRANVAAGLFGPLTKEFTPLAKVLIPVLSAGLSRVSSAIGNLLAGASRTARLAGIGSAINGILTPTADTIRNLAPAVRSVTGTLVHMLGSSTPGLKILSGYAVSLSNSFAALLGKVERTGQLRLWLSHAIDALRQMAQIAWNVYGVLVGIISSAVPSSGGILPALVKYIQVEQVLQLSRWSEVAA